MVSFKGVPQLAEPCHWRKWPMWGRRKGEPYGPRQCSRCGTRAVQCHGARELSARGAVPHGVTPLSAPTRAVEMEPTADELKRLSLARKVPPGKDWLDINETILEVLALTRSQGQENRITLETHLATDLPLILGDRIQLQQVLLNLILNAVEAM